MISFKEQVEKDNFDVFLNGEEFAEIHILNGNKCQCILESDSMVKGLSTGNTSYPMLYGSDLIVYVLEKDLNEVPVYGQTFIVDKHLYLVESVKNDMGMITIDLVANDR